MPEITPEQRAAAEIEISAAHDKPASGMWHCGPNPCWITATHKPTLTSVTLYSGSSRSQHKVREAALAALEMLIGEFGAEPCQFPEQAPTADAYRAGAEAGIEAAAKACEEEGSLRFKDGFRPVMGSAHAASIIRALPVPQPGEGGADG